MSGAGSTRMSGAARRASSAVRWAGRPAGSPWPRQAELTLMRRRMRECTQPSHISKSSFVGASTSTCMGAAHGSGRERALRRRPSGGTERGRTNRQRACTACVAWAQREHSVRSSVRSSAHLQKVLEPLEERQRLQQRRPVGGRAAAARQDLPAHLVACGRGGGGRQGRRRRCISCERCWPAQLRQRPAGPLPHTLEASPPGGAGQPASTRLA